VEAGPEQFLASLQILNPHLLRTDLLAALHQAASAQPYPNVITWQLIDVRRVTPIPPGHWLLLSDLAAFRASIVSKKVVRHVESIACEARHVASVPPDLFEGDATLLLERYSEDSPQIEAALRFLRPDPDVRSLLINRESCLPQIARETGLVLLTNARGAMARLQVNLGEVRSKYDCALAANLHASVPVDRHVFVKRIRVWVVADGFISALNRESLLSFLPGPPAHWVFVASAGDGRAVEIHLTADMLPEENTTVFRFSRPAAAPAFGRDLSPDARVTLTARVDIEDRNFHTETHRNSGAEYHFSANSRPLLGRAGFEFTPANDRVLRVFVDAGQYHHEAEWSTGIFHPVEASRGQQAQGDAYSPGWFDLPVPKNSTVTLLCSAEPRIPEVTMVKNFADERVRANQVAIARAKVPGTDSFGRELALAVQAYVVRRDRGKTVIAGYPWFLDWGRDSLICARGLITAGLAQEVLELLAVFGKFAEQGTLPNSIHGEDASNRDTTDAPLWYGIVCEELAEVLGPRVYQQPVDSRGRTIQSVLGEIASGYLAGTRNGIQADQDSGLVWSPSHFTWMDTNYPASTPREGYPVEIQVLWVRLLRQLARLHSDGSHWSELAMRAEKSLWNYFWMEGPGYPSDVLLAAKGQPPSEAKLDDALRSNCLFAISLGLLIGERAQRTVMAAQKYLVVPGALRSLAPLPVLSELPIRDAAGKTLNIPGQPYAPRYEGDEDTSRKLAYHNGTAWLWTFPSFCEALVRAWDFRPSAIMAARAYLASMDRALTEGCLGQLPEIMDGDRPHLQRGCDAQAWSVTEALRVWRLVNPGGPA
jgi:predicted glycogen debranching enzyme